MQLATAVAEAVAGGFVDAALLGIGSVHVHILADGLVHHLNLKLKCMRIH